MNIQRVSEREKSVRGMIEMRKFLNGKFLLWFFIAHMQLTQVTSLNYLNYDMNNFLWFFKAFWNFNKFLWTPRISVSRRKSTWHLTFSKLLYSQLIFFSFFGIIIKWGFLIPRFTLFIHLPWHCQFARTIEADFKEIAKKICSTQNNPIIIRL